MCLSPELDLAAGVVISAVAVDAIRHNLNNKSMPLALLPGVFAIHSFASALVWFSFQDQIPTWLGDFATNLYIFIAFILLPIYVPITALLIEPNKFRKQILTLFTIFGLISGSTYAYYVLNGFGKVTECTYFLDFHVVGPPTIISALYGIATCGALLFSSFKKLVFWAGLNCVAILILNIRLAHALPSLWCLWAALTSFYVSWFLRDLKKRGMNDKSLYFKTI